MTAGAAIRVAAEEADASPPVDGERKIVTALFADIKGSTELMEELDPEEARAIIDPALKLMIDAVRRYDGYVVQSTGDGIFALFGAPVAHEDHPQRALYTALRMQEELKRYSAKVVADGSTPIQGRVSINTGEVVVRSIQTGAGQVEYTPIGHTTNLASRMQTAAPVGSIAVSEVTRGHCEGYFILKPLGATKVKGVSEPVNVYEVTGLGPLRTVNVYEVTGLGPLRTRLQRAAGRGLTKFVGRQREIETMKVAADQAQAGRGQIVAAMADPGVGKSRLLFEFKATSQSGWMVLETFSISHGKASPFLPVIDLLRNYFDISAGDDERKRREKVTGRVLALDRNLEDTLPHLSSLLGIVEGDDPLAQMDGQIKKRRTLEAIKRILLRESLNQPLMVIFEDLHWIDEQTQELLNLLADSIGTAKFLLLVNYRREYSHQWNTKTYYTQLRLDPLGGESAEEMLSALLGDGEELLRLKRLIIEKTEGNPFFMEETVQVLFDEGALARHGAAVRLTKPLGELKIPSTVQAILAARIDRLPANEKDLLQTLAVLGKDFTLSHVKATMARSDSAPERMLAELQTAEFIYEQPAFPEVEYTFKHGLTQEVAYNSVLVERRKLLHERAGLALESMFAKQLEDHLDELAHHYSRSDNVGKAVEYLGRAGQQALQRSAYDDAINGLTAAIGLLQRLPDSPGRIQRELLLQLAMGPALVAVKGRAAPEVERAYTRARELCERLGDPPELFPALFGLWFMYFLRAELRRAYELAEQLWRLAQNAHDPVRLLYVHLALGVTSYGLGDFLSAKEHLGTAISIYDPERHRSLALRYLGLDAGVYCLMGLASSMWQLGYPDQALKRSNEALALARGLSHPFSLAAAENFVGDLRQYRREASAAQEKAERGIALSAEHGLSDFLAYATILRGWAIAECGHNEEGIAQIEGGLTAFRATGAELRKPYFLCLLAEACMETNRFDDGLSALTEALAAAGEHEDRNHEAEIYRLKGKLLLRRQAERSGAEHASEAMRSELRSLRRADKESSPRGASGIVDSNAAIAQTCFERAIEIARTQSAKSWELRATVSLARLLAKQEKRDEARVMLAEIYGWFTEGFDTADLKEAKALLEQLNG